MLIWGACGKFFGFMLTKISIELNPNKFKVVISMRSPTNIREVHQLIVRLAVLSCFLSYAGDKTFLFFVALKKKMRFKLTSECEEAF